MAWKYGENKSFLVDGEVFGCTCDGHGNLYFIDEMMRMVYDETTLYRSIYGCGFFRYLSARERQRFPPPSPILLFSPLKSVPFLRRNNQVP